ncbi:hypothetical protein [Pseudomonas sp. 2FG]|uniref:hypothetical protein n=1 Tax=Pseudomonas sp. 2FG TaxID=2502191 RepID=UPI0010F53A7F|nr:hypothetical protein [Pseudomonas sp. 2FG]
MAASELAPLKLNKALKYPTALKTVTGATLPSQPGAAQDDKAPRRICLLPCYYRHTLSAMQAATRGPPVFAHQPSESHEH